MMLAQIVAIASFVIAGLAWAVAAWSAFAMGRRLDPNRGLAWLVMNPRVFARSKGLPAAAKPYRRRFLASAGLFFFALLVGILIIALFLSQTPTG